MTLPVDPSERTRDWIDEVEPPVPAKFVEHLRAAGGGLQTPGAEGLAEAAWASLERAVRRGGDRSGAFDLLAADGLLTYACEWALSHEGPDEALEHLARRASAVRSAGIPGPEAVG